MDSKDALGRLFCARAFLIKILLILLKLDFIKYLVLLSIGI